LVDDQRLLLACLRLVLEQELDCEVVGEAASREAALRLLDEHSPDLVVLDPAAPGLDGLSLLAAIHERRPQVAIVVFTATTDEALIDAAIESGARALLSKKTSLEAIGPLFRDALAGRVPVRHAPAQRQTRPDSLTPRELAVLELVAAGDSNEAIAAKLSLSERTVKFHLAKIFRKLGVANRAAATAVALEARLVENRLAR
jgi:DNA-binding NarL/FixJ family response regulator